MSDLAVRSQTIDKPLDSWDEPGESVETTELSVENPEAITEVLFDQTDLVEQQAEEYWTEHVLKRPFEPGEAEFVFNERTHTRRRELLRENETAEGELETSDFADPAEKRLKLLALREKKIQLITEQAWADLNYLLVHRTKIEEQAKKLLTGAESQTNADELKVLAVEARHLSSRLVKFELYTESAVHLFKKYRELAPEMTLALHDKQPDRYEQVMYDMLVATQTNLGQDFAITGQGDRNYLTTFIDLRDKVLSVDYQRLAALTVDEAKQVEVAAEPTTTKDADQTSSSPAEGLIPNILSFSGPAGAQEEMGAQIDQPDIQLEPNQEIQPDAEEKPVNEQLIEQKKVAPTEKKKRTDLMSDEVKNIFLGTTAKPHVA